MPPRIHPTGAHLVEQGESLLELRNLLVSQLVGHWCDKGKTLKEKKL